MRSWVSIAAGLALAATMPGCDGGVSFDARVAQPAFPDGGPIVAFDAGHHNRHAIGSSYRPFAALMRNDGFRLRTIDGALSAGAIGDARILAIVSASSDTDTNDAPAFSPAEIAEITAWVRGGGALLLVTDHYPFPNAVEGLAAALGLDVAKGMTGDPAHHAPGEDDSYLMFARADGLLGAHPILEGRSPRERISRVATFTGDAFRARNGGVVALLPLADTARLRRAVPRVTRNGADTSVEVGYDAPVPGAGWVQGAAFAFGAGRVVVLAEAAMLTAQEGETGPIGMNAPGNDNRQFALNVMRWLGRAY